MADNTISCTVHIQPEETLTVSQYQLSGPHIVIESEAAGHLAVNVAGGGPGVDGNTLLEWLKKTVHILDEALTEQS
jgi:hypothetical protein